ncbi:uncharacterized protein PG998_014861 [Apiospora kogelbergensis]|uniref:uncharacterized protein n=1 Tax=Apiospora kogelbergensis TaxID=1337665 RepID=UPI00312E80E7
MTIHEYSWCGQRATVAISPCDPADSRDNSPPPNSLPHEPPPREDFDDDDGAAALIVATDRIGGLGKRRRCPKAAQQAGSHRDRGTSYRKRLCTLPQSFAQRPGKEDVDAVAKNIHPTTNESNAPTANTTATVAKEEGQKATVEPVPVPVAGTVAPLPIWQRLGPLTRGAEAYARAQRRRPWVTQVATMLVIYLCADISAQQISGKDEHEYERTARSLVIGGVAAIPGHMWFVFLSRNFNYSSKVLSVAVKVAINQAFFTPIFNTYFFGSQALLSGDSLRQSWDRVRATVPVSVVNSCKIWPAVTAVSFAYLPLEYRALFAGVVAVGWQTYLSFLNRQAEAAEALASAAGASQKEDGAGRQARVLPAASAIGGVAEADGSNRSRIAV